jgi:hypothetical protein
VSFHVSVCCATYPPLTPSFHHRFYIAVASIVLGSVALALLPGRMPEKPEVDADEVWTGAPQPKLTRHGVWRIMVVVSALAVAVAAVAMATILS